MRWDIRDAQIERSKARLAEQMKERMEEADGMPAKKEVKRRVLETARKQKWEPEIILAIERVTELEEDDQEEPNPPSRKKGKQTEELRDEDEEANREPTKKRKKGKEPEITETGKGEEAASTSQPAQQDEGELAKEIFGELMELNRWFAEGKSEIREFPNWNREALEMENKKQLGLGNLRLKISRVRHCEKDAEILEKLKQEAEPELAEIWEQAMAGRAKPFGPLASDRERGPELWKGIAENELRIVAEYYRETAEYFRLRWKAGREVEAEWKLLQRVIRNTMVVRLLRVMMEETGRHWDGNAEIEVILKKDAEKMWVESKISFE